MHVAFYTCYDIVLIFRKVNDKFNFENIYINNICYLKAYSNAEGDVGGLSRRVLLLEEEVERSEERLAKAVTELCFQSQRADVAIKKRQQLENLNR